MIDFDVMNSYLDNDQEVIFAVLSAYQEDHFDSVNEIRQAIANKNWQELHHLVHTLKGILASLGEEIAVPVLERMEQGAAQAQAPDADDVTLVLKEIALINQQIEEALLAHSE
ncbi:Hpt domain-containing protein [Vibrio sp. SM6]|uniref:Hpt domain-containing protein n=1 Tax=Vibrio agarilyticus TaxID=2726741 RepID=A0A7X8TNZ7_9VIBR|nr:Hpt domain-containing protein [Vibrio agarilyticus]NLS12044.1 Hpt domain-containing protein [Vibrio agarilyticus]